MTREIDSEKDPNESDEPVFGLRPTYVSPFSERYESGEPATDVWISETEFQCDSCSHVQPEPLSPARLCSQPAVCGHPEPMLAASQLVSVAIIDSDDCHGVWTVEARSGT